MKDNTKEFLDTLIREYMLQEAKLHHLKSTIELFGGTIPSDGLPKSIEPNYSHAWSTKDKILYVLEKDKQAYVEDICMAILQLDGENMGIVNPDKLNSTVAQYCSNFYRDGIIDAEKIGKKNLYKFKEQK